MSEFAAPRGAASARSGKWSAASARAGKWSAAERVLLALASLAAMAALAAGVVVALPPLFRITRFEIRGASSMSREEVLSASLLRSDERFFSLDPERVRAALEAEPRIAKASARRRFPNGLVIEIAERSPVASVLVESGGSQRLAYLDEEGVAFALAYGAGEASGGVGASGGTAQYPAPEGLPLLSGLRIEGFKPGVRLPEELVSALAALGAIRDTEPALLAAFSEIKVTRSRFGETELLLFPLRGRSPVRIGAAPSASDLRSIILVLDVLRARGADGAVSEIDFRTGTVVYRGKEGQSD